MRGTDDRVLWHRHKHESHQAFAAFVCYRDQGPTRSYTNTARILNKNRTSIGIWGSKWNWQSRVTAFDHHVDEQRQTQTLAQRLEQEAELREVCGTTIKEMGKWVQELAAKKKSLNWNAKDMAILLRVIIEARKAAFGLTDRHVHDIHATLSERILLDPRDLSDPELSQLHECRVLRLAELESRENGTGAVESDGLRQIDEPRTVDCSPTSSVTQ